MFTTSNGFSSFISALEIACHFRHQQLCGALIQASHLLGKLNGGFALQNFHLFPMPGKEDLAILADAVGENLLREQVAFVLRHA